MPKPFQSSELSPRLAVRAVIVNDGRLLLVNAWPGGQSDLLCAPGGGVERGTSLPDNLRRELYEETGLDIEVGPVCLVNEFHHPARDFHQVEIFFRCSLIGDGTLSEAWKDPENIVSERQWLNAEEVAACRLKPDALRAVAFDTGAKVNYDPLERVVF